ncbi:hypothetical protein [Zoogloea sp.]|uniref:hypothetical protein n=1 Tax=Zoogloea sp. TaxID=49181 RepID=UPI0026011E88|nr:hypothetical protein [Zoogloea sp.]MCK6395779.1 hypothetical protein [Zoogloea sp.]
MTELIEILKSWPAVSAATVAAIASLIKLTKSIFYFNDEQLQKRKIKKITFLAKECEKNQTLNQLVEIARDEEVFRNMFGRTGSPQFLHALKRAYDTGRFSLSELRLSSSYLNVKDETLVVDLGWGAHALLWFSIGAMILMGLYIGVLLFTIFGTPSGNSYIAALMLMVFYFLFAWFMGGDARAVLIAKRVRKNLDGIETSP